MLSPKEVRIFKRLVKKLKAHNGELPEETFNALNKVLAFPACEMAVADKQKRLLLTWRKDKFWKGWHFPGSVLRNKEEFAEALQRTAQKELGRGLKSFKFLFPMNYPKGARGHSVTFVFLCRLNGKPKNGKFFKIMPKSIIPEHRQLWKRLKNVL